MLDGPINTQRHAFDLLFNLAVQTNLYDDLSAQANPDPTKEEPEANGRIVYTMNSIREDLFQKLKEMIYYIFHKRLMQSSVWSCALNCIFFFISANGRVDKQKLLELDIRFFPVFLERVKNLTDTTIKNLVRMLVNLLYKSNKLNLDDLEEIGGIHYIISLYTSSRSSEVKDNLFYVMYDFILGKMPDVKQEDSSLLLEVFKRLGLPQHLHEIFFFPCPEFVENFTRFLYMDRFKKDPSLTPFAESLNKPFTVAVLYEFEQLSKAFNTPHPDFQSMVAKCIKEEKIPLTEMKILDLLLKSEVEVERKNGELWLFAIIEQFRLGDPNRKVDTELSRTVDDILNALLHSKKPKERQVYLSITNRMGFSRKNKISKQWSENEVVGLLSLLNEKLTRVVNIQETDEDNLVFLFDIIFNLVSVRNVASGSKHDLNVNAFLAGDVLVPYYLLKGINISVIHHIFMNLNQPTRKDIRAVLLVFMIEQCKSKIKLESIGGVSFFKHLLGGRDPQIAFHASRFLVEHLKSERPEKYKALLEDLLSKAQETNDEKLLENPYLQIREILKNFETK